MKKIFLSLLFFLLCIVPMFSLALYEDRNNVEIGKTINNFTIKEIEDFPLIGATITLFQHNKTGAEVLLIKNDDINRAFDITFRTPTETDMGISHVFEHATLSGSEKYPSKTLFFNLRNQIYQTYMNANTYPFMTTYPVSSLSEEQLYNLSDYYLDSCFNPIILRDKTIFDTEAWRYELNSKDDELKYYGTVYSEMLGANTLTREALFNNYKASFPGSIAGNNSGGNTDTIPNMTYQDLLNYHDKYYTPTNSLTILYGEIDDHTKFLKLLDSYFSKYKKNEYSFIDSGYEEITEFRQNEFEYPVEKTSDTDYSCVAFYTFICHDATTKDNNLLQLMSYLIGSESSVLMENMNNALPYINLSVYVDNYGPESSVYFMGNGLRKEDVSTFKDVIDYSLSEIYAESFDDDLINSVISNTKIELLLTGEDPNLGIDISPSFAQYWAIEGNALNYLNYVDTVTNFKDYVNNGQIIDIFERYIINNPYRNLNYTYSVAGLKEKKNEELKNKLSSIKESMSEEELELIIDQTKKSTTTKDSSEYVEKINVITVDNLPEDYKKYEITVNNYPNSTIKHYFAKADVTDVSYINLIFDTSGVEQDKIHFIQLYSNLLGELDTENYTRADLINEINKYIYSPSFTTNAFENTERTDISPVLITSFIALDENLPKAYELLYEILFNSVLDPEIISNVVYNLYTQNSNRLQSIMYNIQIMRLAGIKDPKYAYVSYMNYIEYYEFLKELKNQIDNGNIDYIITGLESIKEYLKNSYNLILAISGNDISNNLNTIEFDKFIAKLPYNEINKAELNLPVSSGEEGIITSSNILFHAFYLDNETLGINKFTSDYSVMKSVILDNILFPLLRDKMGVYTPVFGFLKDSGAYLVTYRDPNDLKTTAEALVGLQDRIDETFDNINQNILNGYILSVYSDLVKPNGELSAANDKLMNILNNTEDITAENIKKLKNLKVENFSDYWEIYKKFIENVYYSTSGSAENINKMKPYYSEILNPFGNQEKTYNNTPNLNESEFESESESESEEINEELMFSYINGFIEPDTNGDFGADDIITINDLSYVLCKIAGVNVPKEEAPKLLADATLLPVTEPNEKLTPESFYQYILYFCNSLNLDSSFIPVPRNATKGELAHILYVVFN